MAPEIVVIQSETSEERVEPKSDSEKDTCFGVVWEKIAEPVQTMKETAVTKGIKMMSYREALEYSRHGEVLRWSSDSEGEADKSDGAVKQKLSCPFDGLFVPETELQNSPGKARKEATETEATVMEATVTETVIEPVKVAKQFEAGLFIGEITAVNIKRGRNLYTVLYEDGDGEDMNDRDYKEARSFYKQTKGASSTIVETQTELEETEEDPLHSGGETEGSEFAPSDDEEEKNRRKTKRQQLKSGKREGKNKTAEDN